jgi:hypothetical protein
MILLKKATPQKKMPTHIAHICLCLPTHKPTQRQSQKSAIANALFFSVKSPFSFVTLQHKFDV